MSSAEVAVQPPPVMYHLRPALALHHRHAKDTAAWLLHLLIEAGSVALSEGADTATELPPPAIKLMKQKSFTAANIFPPQLLRALVNMASLESRKAPVTDAVDTQSFAASETGTWLRMIASVLHLSPANSTATVDSWSRNEIGRLERRLQQIYLAHASDSRSVGDGK